MIISPVSMVFCIHTFVWGAQFGFKSKVWPLLSCVRLGMAQQHWRWRFGDWWRWGVLDLFDGDDSDDDDDDDDDDSMMMMMMMTMLMLMLIGNDWKQVDSFKLRCWKHCILWYLCQNRPGSVDGNSHSFCQHDAWCSHLTVPVVSQHRMLFVHWNFHRLPAIPTPTSKGFPRVAATLGFEAKSEDPLTGEARLAKVWKSENDQKIYPRS